MGADIEVDSSTLRMAANEVTAKVSGYALKRSSVDWRPADSCASSKIATGADGLNDWYQAQWARTRESLGGLADGARNAANAYEGAEATTSSAFRGVG